MDEELILHHANNTCLTQQTFIGCLLSLAVGGQEPRDRQETISLSREFGAQKAVTYSLYTTGEGSVHRCLCIVQRGS